jgi:lipopolysaccharide/colanic/teichoic acid biosynthesis glycosyltransferase
MTRFRIIIILLVVWLAFIFNLERPDFEFLGFANIDLNTTVYVIAAISAVAAIAFPDITRNTATLLIPTFLGYVVGMYLVNRPINQQPISLTVTEIAILSLTVFMARHISLILTRFESTVEDVLLKPQDLRILNKQRGEEAIVDELDRARYFGHPVGLIVLQMANILRGAEKFDSVHFDFELALRRRYVQLRAAQVTRLLLPKVAIIIWDNEDMIIGLPQSDEEMTFTAAYALNRELAVQLNLSVPMGMATFSRDGLIYEDLLNHARNNLLVFADLTTLDEAPVASPDDNSTKADDTATKKSRLPFRINWARTKTIVASLMTPLPSYKTLEEERDLFSHAQGKKLYNPSFWLHDIPYQSLASRQVYQVFKRGIDLAMVFLSMPLVLPLMLVIAALIKLEDGGPVFYSQERTGWGGHTFRMYKFRSMVPNSKDVLRQLAAQGLAKIDENANLTEPLKLERDPRITRIGRFIRRTSLDEIPQILNVLKGDMSIVGPRPTSWKVSNYTLAQTGRLDVRPGITGLWQITERGSTDFDVWLLWDRAYIDHMCLSLDIQIIIRTIGKVFTRSGR